MGSLSVDGILRQLRNGPFIAALVLFGLTLLGLHVYQDDLPQRLARRTAPPPLVDAMMRHGETVEALAGDAPTKAAPAALQVPLVKYDVAEDARDPLVGPWHRQQWAEAALQAMQAGQQVTVNFVPPQLTVQGVIMGSKPFAIVNGRTLRVGDAIEGALVTGITTSGITVTMAGRELQYSVQEMSKTGAHRTVESAPRMPYDDQSVAGYQEW